MKKKIIVTFTGSMEIGGIERSLISLLNSFDYSKYEVDLFLYGHRGPLYTEINKNVNLLPEIKELAYTKESISTKLKHKSYYAVFQRVKSYILKEPIMNGWERIVKKTVPFMEKEYDLAIGFFLPFDVIIHKVKAKKKMGWIHTDYSVFLENFENDDKEKYIKYLKQNYDGVDKICGVSEECKETFLEIFPEYADRTMVIENILSEEFVRSQSDLVDVKKEMSSRKSIKILSVGRFCHPKNFDNIPEICKKLLECGCEIKWYLIGFGGDENLIKRKIEHFNMEDYVIILGKKENPYPYIKECDIYIQPSRYEGKAVAVREAQILRKPVIITSYATSASQLENGVDGIIVSMENNRCAEEIAKVLQDKILLQNIIANCEKRDYSNANEMNRVYEFIK